MTRLLYLVSHPIQYQAPLLRRIARVPGLELRVVFGSMATAGAYRDAGFGVDVAWDVPLLDGYDHAPLADIDLGAEMRRADAVWIHGWQYTWQRRALLQASSQRIPVLLRGENWFYPGYARSGVIAHLKRLGLEWLFARCAAFLAIGSKNRDYYMQHHVPEQRIFGMPYAVDNGFFAERAKAAGDPGSIRRRFGLPDKPLILFVGKLIRRKRPDLLLAAWEGAAWGASRPTLAFAGDGEMKADLEARRSGAHFLGFRNQSELPALYATADLLAVPSDSEPWGLVVNEAMACGTAVVASDAVGAAHDLVDPECGATFRAGDAESLTANLRAALPRAAELGRAAARRIVGWDFEADLRGLIQALHAIGAQSAAAR